jgi:hypothetical protein
MAEAGERGGRYIGRHRREALNPESPASDAAKTDKPDLASDLAETPDLSEIARLTEQARQREESARQSIDAANELWSRRLSSGEVGKGQPQVSINPDEESIPKWEQEALNLANSGNAASGPPGENETTSNTSGSESRLESRWRERWTPEARQRRLDEASAGNETWIKRIKQSKAVGKFVRDTGNDAYKASGRAAKAYIHKVSDEQNQLLKAWDNHEKQLDDSSHLKAKKTKPLRPLGFVADEQDPTSRRSVQATTEEMTSLAEQKAIEFEASTYEKKLAAARLHESREGISEVKIDHPGNKSLIDELIKKFDMVEAETLRYQADTPGPPHDPYKKVWKGWAPTPGGILGLPFRTAILGPRRLGQLTTLQEAAADSTSKHESRRYYVSADSKVVLEQVDHFKKGSEKAEPWSAMLISVKGSAYEQDKDGNFKRSGIRRKFVRNKAFNNYVEKPRSDTKPLPVTGEPIQDIKPPLPFTVGNIRGAFKLAPGELPRELRPRPQPINHESHGNMHGGDHTTKEVTPPEAPKHNELAQEHIDQLLGYWDVRKGTEDEDNAIRSIEASKTDPNTIKYKETLQTVIEELGEDKVIGLATQLRDRLADEVDAIGLIPTIDAKSLTWAAWDLAKQRYYFDHPSESSDEYRDNRVGAKLGDPFAESEDGKRKLDEIVNRHLGWEFERAYKEKRLPREDIVDAYGSAVATIVEHGKRNKSGQLPSHQYARLGKLLIAQEQLDPEQPLSPEQRHEKAKRAKDVVRKRVNPSRYSEAKLRRDAELRAQKPTPIEDRLEGLSEKREAFNARREAQGNINNLPDEDESLSPDGSEGDFSEPETIVIHDSDAASESASKPLPEETAEKTAAPPEIKTEENNSESSLGDRMPPNEYSIAPRRENAAIFGTLVMRVQTKNSEFGVAQARQLTRPQFDELLEATETLDELNSLSTEITLRNINELEHKPGLSGAQELIRYNTMLQNMQRRREVLLEQVRDAQRETNTEQNPEN